MPSKKKKKKGGRGKARKAGSKKKETQQGSLDAQMERLNIDGGGDGDLFQEPSLLGLGFAIKLAAAEKEAMESGAGEKEESTEIERESIDSWKCLHGYVLTDDHFIFEDFVRTFSFAFASFSGSDNRDVGDCIGAAYKTTLEKYPGVWCDSSKLKLVRSFFLSSATENVLEGNFDSGTRFDAFAACFLEDYIAQYHELNPQTDMVLKVIELIKADKHTLVKYLRKSIPCSCLDEKYKEVKSITRMGLCCNKLCSAPNGMVERRSLLCCTGCHAANYCSRECQKAAWPEHKKKCKIPT